MHIKREHPELVLLDLNIPRVDGLQTLKQIRRFDPRIRVIVTGYGGPIVFKGRAWMLPWLLCLSGAIISAMASR